jgi:hypothetical protein
MTRAFVLAVGLFSVTLSIATPVAASDAYVKGRLQGYRGLYEFHIAAMPSRDIADDAGVLAWSTADRETGKFDLVLPPGTKQVYLMGQLDLERMGPRLNGSMTFFLRKLPVYPEDHLNERLLFDLGDMEMAFVTRDAGWNRAVWIALGLAALLYGIGFLWVRRLPSGSAPVRPVIERGGRALYGIALATTLPLLWRLGAEPPELLEFTYLHEGLRPESLLGLLTDPISSELSHPPLWPLLLRLMSAVSREEWWLRSLSVLAHFVMAFPIYRLGAYAGGRRMGLMAALIGGLLPVTFYYGRDATPYAFLACFSATAAMAAVEERWRLFSATLVVGFFCHYTIAVLGVTLGLAMFAASLRGNKGRYRRALIAFGWVCPLPLLWSVHFIRTFLASGMSTRLMSLDYLPDPGFVEYVSHFASIVLGVPPEIRVLAPIPLVVASIGVTHLWRSKRVLARIVGLQLFMVVAYVLFVHAMYMSFAAGRVFYAYRWSSVFLPAVAVAMSAGLAWIAAKNAWLGRLIAIAAVVSFAFQDVRVLLSPQRPDQRQMVERMQAERQPEDAFTALPAVYYAQLMNYALFEREPEDLLAWPRWTDGLYGPFHARNTTIETLSKHLAFRRIWVAAYDEHMFGTRKFDPVTSAHQLEWMQKNLVPDGRWDYPYLTLYRFKVPVAADDFWTVDGTAVLDFSQEMKLFRYFPQHLHTQETGLIRSAAETHIRVPAPATNVPTVSVVIELMLGRDATADELRVQGRETRFEAVVGGGRWHVSIPVLQPFVEFVMERGPKATEDQRNIIVTFDSST